MTIDQDLANDYLEILQHEDNTDHEAVVLHECMICKKFKGIEDNYVEVHPALRIIYKENPFYEVSSGFCPQCYIDYRREQGLK